MEGSGTGRHIIAAAAAAFALSGCSFLFLSYLRDRSTLLSKPILPTCSITHNNIKASYSVKGARRTKRVRFVVGVKENESRTKKQELLNKKNKKKKSGEGRKSEERRKERESLPENWRNLYSGMNRYRSQQATLGVYA